MNNKTLLLMLLPLSACATIIDGTSQKIEVNTNPPAAACAFIRNNQTIANIKSTPDTVKIDKDKHDIVIECTKEGYEKATFKNHSGAAAATWGNIAAGGLIGWGVDSAVGADNKYESPVNVTLVPIVKK